MINRKILVVGHPRTGTGYMSKLLSSTGLEIGHEWIGSDGMSCWMFATEDGNYAPGPRGDIRGLSRKDFEFQHIIHLVKNPFTSMSSIVNVENAVLGSYEFRKKYVYINDRGSRLEKAVQSFLGWHEMIEKNIRSSRVIQIENSQAQLKSFLADINLPNNYKVLPPTDYNTRKGKKQYSEITQSEWDNLSVDLKNRLDLFCEKYGYEKIKYTNS